MDQAVTATVRRQLEPRICVFEAPPRHGKSMFLSEFVPAWFVTRYPKKRVILTSYEATFARSWGRKARTVARRASRMFGGMQLSRSTSAQNDWETTAGGGMVTAGIGGPITGKGADLLIIDDPIKNAEEAISEGIREKHWDWWQTTARTRLEPGAVVLIIMTRWHEDDLVGRLTEKAGKGESEPLTKLTMRAVAEHDDVLGRAEGEALWPERFTIADLELIKNGLDPFWWSSLYQQRPGQFGKAEWPSSYFEGIIAETWPDRFDASVIAIDPSKGRSAKSGDYSAIVFLGLSGDRLYVDADIKRRPVDQIARDTVAMYNRYPTDQVGLESNAFQDLLAPIFDKVCEELHIPPLPIAMINNSVNKQLRISRLGAYLDRHKFAFRRGSDGVDMLIKMLKAFPFGDHDDGPDGLEMALRLLIWHTKHASAEIGTTVFTT